VTHASDIRDSDSVGDDPAPVKSLMSDKANEADNDTKQMHHHSLFRRAPPDLSEVVPTCFVSRARHSQ